MPLATKLVRLGDHTIGDEFGATFANTGRDSTWVELKRSSAQVGPELADAGRIPPMLVDFGPNSANLGPELGQPARIRPESAHVCGRMRPKSGGFGEWLRRRTTFIIRLRAGFVPERSTQVAPRLFLRRSLRLLARAARRRSGCCACCGRSRHNNPRAKPSGSRAPPTPTATRQPSCAVTLAALEGPNTANNCWEAEIPGPTGLPRGLAPSGATARRGGGKTCRREHERLPLACKLLHFPLFQNLRMPGRHASAIARSIWA